MKLNGWIFACLLTACSGTQAQQSAPQEPKATPASATPGETAPTAMGEHVMARPDTAPNFTISEAQAEAACDKGAQKALSNEDKDLMITVALCQKLQEMFPNSASLKYSLATLHHLNGNADKATPLQTSACEAAKKNGADQTLAAKYCAPLPKAGSVNP